jgi:molybdopterin converting factor small subunit
MIRAVLILTTLLALVPAAQAAPAAIVIQGDAKLGRFDVKRDGTLRGAIAAFGRPGSLRRSGLSCYARWPRIRLRISFYNLGGRNPCQPRWGYFSLAEIVGSDWQTRSGLKIGDPLRALRARYPSAQPHPPYWWLIVRRTPFGLDRSYPGLSAKVQDGRVVAFVVRYAAGGD